jgi:tetratricopeptide (TPR) repeat protein
MIQARQLMGLIGGIALSGAVLAAETIPAATAVAVKVSVPEGSTGSASSPSRQYGVAYESLMQANWLKKEGMSQEAFELYKEAQALFQKLAAEYPLWETNVVAFRIKYCADELAAFRDAATPAAGAAPKPVLRAASEAPAAAPAMHRPAGNAQTLPASPERFAQIMGSPPEEQPADSRRVRDSLSAALQKERASNLKEALEGYLTVLAEEPRNRDAIKGAGRCYLRAGLSGDAQAILEQGMLLPNPDADLNLLMALIYCVTREYYKAYQLLLIVLDGQPSNAAAHLAMGVAQAGLNKLDDARVETQKAIQLDPKLGEAYYNLARISLKLKPASPSVAREHYRNALRYGAAPDPVLAKQLQ